MMKKNKTNQDTKGEFQIVDIELAFKEVNESLLNFADNFEKVKQKHEDKIEVDEVYSLLENDLYQFIQNDYVNLLNQLSVCNEFNVGYENFSILESRVLNLQEKVNQVIPSFQGKGESKDFMQAESNLLRTCLKDCLLDLNDKLKKAKWNFYLKHPILSVKSFFSKKLGGKKNKSFDIQETGMIKPIDGQSLRDSYSIEDSYSIGDSYSMDASSINFLDEDIKEVYAPRQGQLSGTINQINQQLKSLKAVNKSSIHHHFHSTLVKLPLAVKVLAKLADEAVEKNDLKELMLLKGTTKLFEEQIKLIAGIKPLGLNKQQKSSWKAILQSTEKKMHALKEDVVSNMSEVFKKHIPNSSHLANFDSQYNTMSQDFDGLASANQGNVASRLENMLYSEPTVLSQVQGIFSHAHDMLALADRQSLDLETISKAVDYIKLNIQTLEDKCDQALNQVNELHGYLNVRQHSEAQIILSDIKEKLHDFVNTMSQERLTHQKIDPIQENYDFRQALDSESSIQKQQAVSNNSISLS